MTKMNRPSVSSVTGRVSRISTGRTSVFNKPSTSAATRAAQKLLTSTPA